MKIRSTSGGVSFEVHAKPRAKKSRVLGVREGALEVQLAAPPVDGAANEALIKLLSVVLGVPRRDVDLLRGASSRKKQILVVGLSEDEVRARLCATPESNAP